MILSFLSTFSRVQLWVRLTGKTVAKIGFDKKQIDLVRALDFSGILSSV